MSDKKNVLVTGGGTFLGDNIAAALLAEGANVTLLVRPGAESRLGGLQQRVRWFSADVWEPSSLKGRARGMNLVVHTVGSLTADPSKGLSYQWLNFVSARNVANLCVSSGVPHMVLISSTSAPWIHRDYIRAKRDAEDYIERVGLKATVIRAPITYVRGEKRSPFYRLMSVFGSLPPLSWMGFRGIAPLPIDVIARAVARIALDANAAKPLYKPQDLRRYNSKRELRKGISQDRDFREQLQVAPMIEMEDADAPFGWSPTDHGD
jgi:uncharacterized protein YbjT (DUF2867 family)